MQVDFLVACTGDRPQRGHMECVGIPDAGAVGGRSHAAASLPVSHGCAGHSCGAEALEATAFPLRSRLQGVCIPLMLDHALFIV